MDLKVATQIYFYDNPTFQQRVNQKILFQLVKNTENQGGVKRIGVKELKKLDSMFKIGNMDNDESLKRIVKEIGKGNDRFSQEELAEYMRKTQK